MPSPQIPPNFLRGPHTDAKVHRIDFTQTTPPIPAFKDHFAAVIDNFMTESECKTLLRLAEESTLPPTHDPSSTPQAPTWQRAMINAGGGKEVMSVDTRKSGRIILDSPDLAQRILNRLLPYLGEFDIEHVRNQRLVTGLGPARRLETWSLSRLNERLRFLRYEGGDYFRPHWDGCYVTPDGREKSLFTIHLYLNGEGEQDLDELMGEIERAERAESGDGLFEVDGEGRLRLDVDAVGEEETSSVGEQATLLGGATSFTDSWNGKDAVRVFPKTGSVLIFQQRNLLHGGDDVFRGVKYTVRTDIMYSCGQSS